MTIPTPHIEATDIEQIAKTVIMPGDPLRAKFITEKYLDNVQQFNSVRGMLGYTGTFNGQKVSVMGSGMGIPSIGIYAYELFKFYNVEQIIRVGSCGSYSLDYKLFDVVLALDAYSESTFAKVQNGDSSSIMTASSQLNQKIKVAADKLKIKLRNTRVHSSDVFYRKQPNFQEIRDTFGCNVIEMEAFALFSLANALNKQAACLLTISDSLVTREETNAQERQMSFLSMMEIALNAAIS